MFIAVLTISCLDHEIIVIKLRRSVQVQQKCIFDIHTLEDIIFFISCVYSFCNYFYGKCDYQEILFAS